MNWKDEILKTHTNQTGFFKQIEMERTKKIVMNTTEGNKLIAEFMGYKFYKHLPIKRDGWQLESNKDTALYLAYSDSDLKYHTSWDWLMPVVEKCYQCDYEEGGDMHMRMNDAIMTINIEEVYQAVVEFIKWYNENK
jgi:frataxin-like iron-binding protein CyaY